MTTKTVCYFALVLGIVFAVVGVAGFIPGLVVEPAPPPESQMIVEGAHVRLFGLFPVNWLHNLVHIVFGAWGIAAYRRFSSARTYAKSVAVIYAILAVMGLIPGLQTAFGLVPLYSHDIWLHIVIALAAAYFGFARVAPETTATGTAGHRI